MALSLTSALRTAQNSIFNSGTRTAVLASNIAGASNPNYVRRDASLVAGLYGSQTVAVRRDASSELLYSLISADAASAAQRTLSDATTRLNRLVNGVDGEFSISSSLTEFEKGLQLFSGDPGNDLLAGAAVASAMELVDRLNGASLSVQSFRAEADMQIRQSVSDINRLLGDFNEVNDAIVAGTRTGKDTSQLEDNRDALLKEISTHIAVNPIVREGNDVVLYTYQGVTLFETVPREVSFDPVPVYDATVTGNLPRIDGVPVDPGVGASTSAQGEIAAWIQVRDEISTGIQYQLDEVARGLVTLFAETDQTASGLPPAAGLFTWSGGPGIPVAGALSAGIAFSISVNSSYSPGLGGNPLYLRDSGAAGAAYIENTSGGAGFAPRLVRLVESLGEPFDTDPAAGLTGSFSVSGYAEASVGWLEGIRSESVAASERKGILSARYQSQLQNETGVNIDEEMTRLVELEQSYEASARVISTVDQLFQILLDSVR